MGNIDATINETEAKKKQIVDNTKKYQQELKKKHKLKLKQKKQTEDNQKHKLGFFFKSLFTRKLRNTLVKEQADYFSARKIDECDSTSALDKSMSEINSCDTNPKQ